MRFAALLLFLSTAGFAGTWSGFLVDSRCWTSRQNNVTVESTTVARAMNADVRFCSPTHHTKRFAVVLYDWRKLRFDPTGNARAAQVVANAPERSSYDVIVQGLLSDKKTIKVGSLSARAFRTTRH
jgi:hypothetical protein